MHQHLSEAAIDRCFTKKLFRELLLQSLGNSSLQIPLINFWPIFPFHTRWKHEKTFGFLVFSEGIKWAHRPEMFHKVTGLHATATDVSTDSDVTHVKNYSTNVWKLPGFPKILTIFGKMLEEWTAFFHNNFLKTLTMWIKVINEVFTQNYKKYIFTTCNIQYNNQTG